MEIQQQNHGAVAIMRPNGPLIKEDADDFKERFLESSSSRLGRVVVDLSTVPFVDSRGVEVFVEIVDELTRSGQTLRLCSVNSTIREVFTLTDVDSKFEHFEDTNAAVRSFL